MTSNETKKMIPN